MADDSLVPISDEQAKLGQDALKVLRGVGSFVEKALGDVPETFGQGAAWASTQGPTRSD